MKVQTEWLIERMHSLSTTAIVTKPSFKPSLISGLAITPHMRSLTLHTLPHQNLPDASILANIETSSYASTCFQ